MAAHLITSITPWFDLFSVMSRTEYFIPTHSINQINKKFFTCTTGETVWMPEGVFPCKVAVHVYIVFEYLFSASPALLKVENQGRSEPAIY